LTFIKRNKKFFNFKNKIKVYKTMKKDFLKISLLVIFTLFLTNCKTKKMETLKVDPKNFDTVIDGKQVALYTLENDNGIIVQITNYGGRIVSLIVPDKNGNKADIVTGYDNIKGYVNDKSFFGGIIGRYGNRIGKGKFVIDGKEYQLPLNDGPNSLHGGLKGFDYKVWDVVKATKDSLVLQYISVDGEEGYPGNLKVEVIYSINNNNELKIDYKAETDATTVVNLTNHAYFNLSGHDNGDILGHLLMINGSKITPVDSTLIPTGEFMNVEGTPFDFRKLQPIGARINDDHIQIKYGKGYDHNWVLDKDSNEMSLAAELVDTISGRVMEVYTTEPGIQFYSGNFLDGTIVGKNGISYKYRHALCLETQHFPDSPNKPSFPSTILRPGEVYKSTTIYKFSVK